MCFTFLKNRKKSFLGIIVLQCVVPLVLAYSYQDFQKYQETMSRQTVEEKLNTFLIGDPSIKKQILITGEGLYIFPPDTKNTNVKSAEFFLRFGSKKSPMALDFIPSKGKKPLSGLRLAIDPGHVGGNIAHLEERFVPDPQNISHILFDEGTLTVATAHSIAQKIRSLGATVMLTRQKPGESVYHESFDTWAKNTLGIKNSTSWQNPTKQQEIINFLKTHATHADQQDLKRRLQIIEKKSVANRAFFLQQSLFRLCYNGYDLCARAEKINAFNPHLVIIIHYNGKETFTPLNYNLAFIPGCYLPGRLDTIEERYHFIRLLVTPTIEQSLAFCQKITPQMVTQLAVPLLSDPEYLDKTCTYIEPGIYANNLRLLRLVTSPILCYGETLVQNNVDEYKRLLGKDTIINGLSVPNRVAEVARIYIQGILDFYGIIAP
jgi:N-acetylmuramoyl-L-alanine amidase